MELDALARKYELDFIALFGSTARDGRGRDVDLAVMPRELGFSVERRLQLYDDLCSAMAPTPVDLAWLPNASWLLSWQVARDGRALWETRPGQFESFRQAAYWRRVDSGGWRRLEREYLERFLKRELGMDRELISRKLLQMSTYLAELEMVLGHPGEDWEKNPLLLRTAERDTELLVECAARVNTAIGQARGIPPSDYYSSFFALVPDWLDRETASGLADAARLRNLLVHQYENVSPEQVHASARATAPLWRLYLQAVKERL
jgi:uncharacterized protein YutE (UPF0331/DUF86 family)